MPNASSYSRLITTPLTIFDGQETYGKWATPSWLINKPEDRFISNFRVNNRFEGRPDLISLEIYGNIKLDWVLVAFNSIHFQDREARNGLNWPRSGSTIKYPDISIITQSLI
jgi:hypothetical protein